MHGDNALDTTTLSVWYTALLSFALWCDLVCGEELRLIAVSYSKTLLNYGSFFFVLVSLLLVGLASAALGEARAQLAPVQLPSEESGDPVRTSGGTDWLTRLRAANEVARDSFIMMFTSAVIISLVGANSVLAILTWTLFLVTVLWKVGTLLYGGVIHCAFTVVAATILMTVFVLAMLRA
ncbi:hypothetical protein HDU87_001591 [Geranomyces variabilis]|uniref:Uncharacterized protein n=1 Tax=Geranomyces variabilis TaxID=109894 RepID=A0AAD5TMD7_9FUNG|nr:hypothetical protein HDU87_001591 [Geranomyces variabilis]